MRTVCCFHVQELPLQASYTEKLTDRSCPPAFLDGWSWSGSNMNRERLAAPSVPSGHTLRLYRGRAASGEDHRRLGQEMRACAQKRCGNGQRNEPQLQFLQHLFHLLSCVGSSSDFLTRKDTEGAENLALFLAICPWNCLLGQCRSYLNTPAIIASLP